jgi:hypothetical protein
MTRIHLLFLAFKHAVTPMPKVPVSDLDLSWKFPATHVLTISMNPTRKSIHGKFCTKLHSSRPRFVKMCVELEYENKDNIYFTKFTI